MEPVYPALDIAKYIVTKCVRDDSQISNLQLQKILFCVQKEFLQNKNRELFVDAIQAWRFGPVVPNVYYYFSCFGGMPITSEFCDVVIDTETQEIIDKVVNSKRTLDPWELVAQSHNPTGAWARVYNNNNGSHAKIDTALIRELG